jgi:hypothetical protein
MTTAISRIEQHAAPSVDSTEGRRPIAQIVSDLSRPVSQRHIRQRKQGGATLSYIEWFQACNYLDHFAPGWQWSILSVSEIGGMICIHGRLTITASDGIFSREATGVEDASSKFGDPFSNASAMALKRCAALFSLGRHLYHHKSQD